MNKEELQQYESRGFLVVKDFIAGEACDRLRQRAGSLVREFDPQEIVSVFSTHAQTRTSDNYFLESGDKIRFFFEENAFKADGGFRQAREKSINKIGHALHDLDPVFAEFSRRDEIKQLVLDLGIDQPLLLQSMYIFKQPNIGGEVTCHQDAAFLYTEPLRMVGLWFALEDATIENGCLWVIPGGHQLGLKSRFVRAPMTTDLLEASDCPPDGCPDSLEAGSRPPEAERTRFEVFDDSPWPDEKLKPLEVEQGTLIVLHPLLPHLSRENRSPKSRHAYTLHIIDASVNYPEDNWLQRAAGMPLRGF